MIIRKHEELYAAKVVEFKGKMIYTTNLRKPPYRLYLDSLKKIIEHYGELGPINKGTDDISLIEEVAHRYQEKLTLYKTIGNILLIIKKN